MERSSLVVFDTRVVFEIQGLTKDMKFLVEPIVDRVLFSNYQIIYLRLDLSASEGFIFIVPRTETRLLMIRMLKPV